MKLPIVVVTNRRRRKDDLYNLYSGSTFSDAERSGAEIDCIMTTCENHLDYQRVKSEEAFRDIQSVMKDRKVNCVFFVHGFNNSWEESLRAAEKIRDLYNVCVVMFSWPSDIDFLPIEDYREKKQHAKLSFPALDRTLGKFYHLVKTSEYECGQTVNAVFHSMGNYLFQFVVHNGYFGRKQIFDNVVLASPDINAEGSHLFIDRIQCRGRVYFTVNERDAALRISTAKRGKQQKIRRGCTFKYHDSFQGLAVDFTDAKRVRRDHSYFKGHKNPKVVGWFHEVLNGESGIQFMKEVIPNKLFRIE